MKNIFSRFLLAVGATIILISASAFVLKENHMLSSDICSSCSFKGKKLYGKVQVVESFPDIKVQIVESFPDLKVQKVTSFPDKCGKWQFVTSFPDIKVQFVTSFPDIKIKYVESFPGCN